VVHGDDDFAVLVRQAVEQAAFGLPWQPVCIDEISDMRERLEASRPARDLKRGPGGLADVEFLVQMFQLKYGAARPELRAPNTWQALAALRDAGLLDDADYATLKDGYDFLLRVTTRLRIVHNRTLDAVPESTGEVEKLARRLGFDCCGTFLTQLEEHRSAERRVYQRLVERES
jgi:glutamate-ammonia-ligase adenylyltransferase